MMEMPLIRTRLITEALTFVHAASKIPGVIRIALIGSLTTNKADPKDVDMLVTVADDADLAPLARIGRRLQGRAQTMNRGGEVFLADERGGYLGRICPWRECAPGIRMRCDAQHCGRRPHLHDDLKTIKLSKALIAAPPIELWPQVVIRVVVPTDVEQGLIVPLSQFNSSD
jgi:predicted nucleotidyltransferase